ncbi:MAG: hypothetical protein JNN24_07385 [Hyphomicrobium zavarzinii]|uniref:hypothetical protein n=1 Tax=Hyphomicrobium zavarzinii TaxID=48292 RepID=UPI001A43A719|nr:hypothetical protein [Hyphomicrobium zavarzinii]MBL8845577.1 hypothetical protein [Hyphomicrobium zavarzinii]
MLDAVRRRDVLAWACGTVAIAALPQPLAGASAASSLPSPPLRLSPVFADVVARMGGLVAAYAEARRAQVGYVEADLALRRTLLQAIEAFPQTLDDCDAQERCEAELAATIADPSPCVTPLPPHEHEALTREALAAYRASEHRRPMREHVERLRQGLA